jgi:hypothetical protein
MAVSGPSEAALGLVNASAPSPVESHKVQAFAEGAATGGAPKDIQNIGIGLHAHLSAHLATLGAGININSSG